jgi:hypothetical protein
MRISIRRSRVRLAWAALLAGIALAPAAASAQIDTPGEAPRRAPGGQRAFCYVGRPAESCRMFLVAEGNAYGAFAGSRYRRTGYQGEVRRHRHLAPHIAWEVGAMRNITERDAVGAVLLVGGDANGERVALKGRYRRWLTPRSAVDVGAGGLFARRAEPRPGLDEPGNVHVPVAGVTGDVAVGLTDWVGVSVRGDLLLDADGERAHALYGGLKLGTRPAVVVTLLPVVLGVIGTLIIGVGGGGG